jgi:hypothetical protein
MPDGKELMPPMMIETSTGRRPVRAILRGTTTVRPNRRLVLREDGRDEIFGSKDREALARPLDRPPPSGSVSPDGQSGPCHRGCVTPDAEARRA